MKGKDGFLSSRQVVADLGLGISTVHRWIIEGKIPSIRIGRNYRIPLEPYLKFKASYVHCEDEPAPQIHKLMEEWLNHLRTLL